MLRSRNLILLIGICLVVFNTLCWLTVGEYGAFEYFMADIGLGITTGLLYYVFGRGLSNGFRISLSIIFIFTGLVRVACLVCMDDSLKDNFLFLAACGILIFEILLLAIVKFVDTK